ncbi:MAG: outer membrane lipoprotein LolB [Ramlibacter sp.]|nr:outer membrane lipoprotein LolB [Ramlibacter sp.]
MSLRVAGARGLLLAASLALAAGCASPPRTVAPADGAAGPWSGRLALEVQEDPPRSFSAGFELRGSATVGELALYNPMGGTLAVLAWGPGSARLRSNGQTREFESVQALAAHATGAPIPVSALFDWLRGIDTPAPGWQADLSSLGEGRLRARRLQPPPRADLRLVLERP